VERNQLVETNPSKNKCTIWVFLKNQSFEITQIKLFYGVEVFAFIILLKTS
jgi:hypothetical protein